MALGRAKRTTHSDGDHTPRTLGASVLSLGTHGSAGGAAGYFSDHLAVGDYYLSAPGRWHPSRAVSALGLSSRVAKSDFAAVAAGFGKDGEPLVQGAGSRHRAGIDLTFSAPKSVSVLWALSSESRRSAILQAHERAVTAALSLVQRLAIRVRIGKGGAAAVPAQVLAAVFVHETSRMADPQLHSHAFVCNCGLRPDEKWGAIETRHLYAWQAALGTAYRAQLAQELERLGYDMAEDGRAFQVRGVPERACEEFSRRRAAIEEAAQERGVSTARGLEVATLSTRGAKAKTSAEDLRRDWQQRGRAVGFGLDEAARLTKTCASRERQIDTSALLDALTQYDATFSVQALWRAVAEAAQLTGGGISQIQRVIAELQKGSNLVAVGADRYTTREMLQLERQALADATSLAGTLGVGTAAYAARRPISAEQARALAHVVSEGCLAIVEGRAGTGKSYMLGAAYEIWSDQGREVIGAALAGKAAEGLEAGSGIPSQTLHSLLYDLEAGKRELSARTVVVIDEAGMVGTRQMAQLISLVRNAGAKLVLVGDSAQLQSVEAGGVFRRLSRDLGAAEMVEIRRQRKGEDRAVVEDLMRGESEAAFGRLDSMGRVHLSDGQPGAIRAMVQDWLSVTKDSHAGSALMIAATRVDVRLINEEARQALKHEGRIGPSDTTVAGISLVAGDRLLFLKNDRRLGVKNGSLGTLIEVEQRQLTVRLDNGATISFDPEIYSHVTHGYAVTAHKSQGATVYNAFVLLSDRMASREWGYVAGSRHRDALHVYADRTGYESLVAEYAESKAKGMAVDHLDSLTEPIAEQFVKDLPHPMSQAAGQNSDTDTEKKLDSEALGSRMLEPEDGYARLEEEEAPDTAGNPEPGV